MTTDSPPVGPTPAPAPSPVGPHGPVREPQRILGLDVLRGLAIFGIYMVNMQFFALPFMHIFGYGELADAPLREQVAWGVVKVFFEFKFISLFSLLFGMGLAMQLMRAAAAGRSFAPLHLRRMGVLAVFGLLHGLLLWYGDILFLYAIVGTVLLLLLPLSPRTLLIIAAISIGLSVVLATGCGSIQLFAKQMQGQAAGPPAAAATEVDPAPPVEEIGPEELGLEVPPERGWSALLASQFDPSRDAWIDGEIAAYKDGPFLDTLAFRAVTYGFALIAAPFTYGWRVAGMFLLGAALMKLEFFRPDRRPWYGRLALLGLGLGLPLELLSAWLNVVNDFQYNFMALGAASVHEVAAFFVCLGYLGLTMLALGSPLVRTLAHPLACVGRLALSNYLLETIIATTIMYWWGLGWFNDVTRPAQIGLAVAIYAGLMVFSVLWMRWMAMGPFEWLWRSLTYARVQRLARRRA